MAKAPVATYGLMQLYAGSVRNLDPKQKGEYPLDGVTVTFETGEQLRERVTMARFATMGLFALGAKKKSGGESYMLIEGPGFFWTVEVKRGDQGKAQKFAAAIRAAAAKA